MTRALTVVKSPRLGMKLALGVWRLNGFFATVRSSNQHPDQRAKPWRIFWLCLHWEETHLLFFLVLLGLSTTPSLCSRQHEWVWRGRREGLKEAQGQDRKGEGIISSADISLNLLKTSQEIKKTEKALKNGTAIGDH